MSANGRSYRARAIRSARTLRSRGQEMQRPSSSCSLVQGNFRLDSPEFPRVPEVYINRKEKPRHKEITINDSPMMLLPKARVRDSLDYYDRFRRSYTVVADTSTQGLHISTIQSVNGFESRLPQKSALKSRRSSIEARSEADSGFCSLKRAVTFENLNQSQSSVYKSDEEFDNFSDSSSEKDADDNGYRMSSAHMDTEEYPDHLECFGGGEAVLPDLPVHPSRASSRNDQSWQKRPRHGEAEYHNVSTCEICGTVLSDKDKVLRKFGKVDSFLDWVMSRWGPRRELQYVPRPSYVYRNHTPHFCNFVHQISLHNRKTSDDDSIGVPDPELAEETEFILESAEGRLISKYRKSNSNSSRDSLDRGMTHTPKLEDYNVEPDAEASGTEGRPGSPSSLDGDGARRNADDDDDDGEQQQPVTGIARTSSSIPEEADDRLLDGDGIKNAWGDNSELSRGHKHKSVGGQSSSDSEHRAPSPSQPPPSPEPQKQQKLAPEIPLPVTPAKKRGCASKKTKKPLERTRSKKPMEELKPTPEPEKVEEKLPETAPVLESDKVDAKLDLKVPDLPSNTDNKDTPKKGKSKSKRHLIEVEDDLHKLDPNDILNEQLKQNRADFDWSTMETNGTEEVKRQPQIKSWISGRLALSQQSSRFELPMDMKNLETMTPQEYIKKHCIITSRRANLYQKIFLKNKDKSQTILYKDLDRSLKDVLVNTITSEQVQDILRTLGIDENTKMDYKLFAGVAAFAERVLYPQFVTEDTHDMPEYQREKIECADFCALPWKLHGINVNPDMRKLLEQIR